MCPQPAVTAYDSKSCTENERLENPSEKIHVPKRVPRPVQIEIRADVQHRYRNGEATRNAFALDLCGKGVAPKNAQDAASRLGLTGTSRDLARGRAEAGLNVLARQPQADPKRIAAGFSVCARAAMPYV